MSAAPADSAPAAQRITLSLISHTNVGKTTLARTLLRRDVGVVDDAAHVTTVNEAYSAIETGDKQLLLWDTPGFGDSYRLLKRLRREKNPVLWFLTQTWDRIIDRPLWCSQQALKNVREDADVVLYLVNASEPPEAAAYVKAEMEILGWVGKPVLVLLNQTGPPQPAAIETAEISGWTEHMRQFETVTQIVPMDAFARCWIHEHRLLESIGDSLNEEKRPLFASLQTAWRERNESVFKQSARVLGGLLAAAARDGADVRAETLKEKLGIGRTEINRAYNDARQVLAERLAERIEATTNELIHLHGLEGQAGKKLSRVSRQHFKEPEKISESVWSVVGSFAGGAMGGLIADLKLGGMTFGGGALVGGLATGLGAYALIRSYNLVRGEDTKLHWSLEHFREQVRLAVLCYLAISHFGRGRGAWFDGDQPQHWRNVVDEVMGLEQAQVDKLWKLGGTADDSAESGLPTRFADLMRRMLREVLLRLYPTVNK
jgi:hypothetical protein